MALTTWLNKIAKQSPNLIALVEGERTVTYGKLKELVTGFAGALANLGATKETRICILSRNSDHAVISFWAAIWAGCIPNFMNTRWSESELLLSILDCDARFLLVDDHFLNIGKSILSECPQLKHLIHIGDSSQINAPGHHGLSDLIAQSLTLEDRSGSGQDDAFINYTGGTTGKGKGVVHTHKSHLSGIASCLEAGFFMPNSTCALVVPQFHIGGISCISATLMTGGTLVISGAFEPQQLLRLVERHKIDTLFMVPTMYRMLLSGNQIQHADLSTLKHIRYGGSPIDRALLRQLLSVFPTAELMQIYGQTEGVPICFLHPEDHISTGGEDTRLKSAGRAASGVKLCIRDPGGSDLADGEIGEICFSSTHTMDRYWNQPDQTEETLRGDWCYSGDAGYLSDGYLYIADRIKDMIISGGENVYCVEVESALLTHPLISQCAVIGVQDDKWGERVHAVCLLDEAQHMDLAAIREHCRGTLASYKLPRSFSLVERIPLTAVGKVDKVAIRALIDESSSE